MAACLGYSINGLHLSKEGGNGDFWLMDGTEYAPAVTMRHSVVEVPGRHGEIPVWDDRLSAMQVALRVRVRGEDADDLRVKWDNLTALLGIGQNAPVELRRHRDEQDDWSQAQLVSTTTPDFSAARSFMDVTILLNVPAGRWKDDDFTEHSLAIPGAEQSSPLAVASSMPVSDFMVRVLGPLSTVTVTDNISGTGISWGGATVIPAGQYLLVDVGSMTAWQRADDAWTADGTNVSATLAFTGIGPLTLASRISGPTLTRTSSVTVTASGTTGATALALRGRATTL